MSSNNGGANLPDLSQGTIDDHAEGWLAYLYSGAVTHEGRAQFRQWLSVSAEHRSAYAQTEMLWQALMSTGGTDEDLATNAHVLEASVDRRPRRQRISVHDRRPMPRRHGLKFAGGMAAAIVIGSVGVHLFSAPLTRETIATAPGEIREVTLADGTQLTMGGDTALKTEFFRSSRKVEFIRGGAFFKVHKDPNRPFRVFIDNVTVTVTGTAFDIRENPNDVRISVAEGRVRVGPKGGGWLSKPKSDIQLGIGQQVVATRAGDFDAVTTFDDTQVLAWKQGRLIYIDEKLSNIIAEVNRYRKSKIRLADPALGDKTITTIVKIQDTDRFLANLAGAENLVVTEDASGTVVSNP